MVFFSSTPARLFHFPRWVIIIKKNSVHLPPPPAYPIQDVLYSVHTCDRLPWPSPWLAELSIFNPTHLLCLRKRGWILNSNLELLGITNRMNNLLEQPQTLTLHIFGMGRVQIGFHNITRFSSKASESQITMLQNLLLCP